MVSDIAASAWAAALRGRRSSSTIHAGRAQAAAHPPRARRSRAARRPLQHLATKARSRPRRVGAEQPVVQEAGHQPARRRPRRARAGDGVDETTAVAVARAPLAGGERQLVQDEGGDERRCERPELRTREECDRDGGQRDRVAPGDGRSIAMLQASSAQTNSG